MNTKEEPKVTSLRDFPAIRQGFELWKASPKVQQANKDNWQDYEAALQAHVDEYYDRDELLLALILSVDSPLQCRMNGWEDWEAEVSMPCFQLVTAKKASSREAAAKQIGEIIARQLALRRFDAPRIVSEFLLNLQAGKPLKAKPGPKSQLKGSVLLAITILRLAGLERPSQRDVKEYLRQAGVSISDDQLSKIFDSLGFKERAGDARRADNPRRRIVRKNSPDGKLFSTEIVPAKRSKR